MIRIPQIAKGETRKPLFMFDSDFDYIHNATVAKDPNFGCTPSGGMRITNTNTFTTTVRKNLPNIPLHGKYFSMFIYVHNIDELGSLTINMYTGDPANNDRYSKQMLTASPYFHLQQGPQVFDVHVDVLSKNGTPGSTISQIEIVMTSRDGGNPIVTVDAMEMCSRKPWACYVQDGPARAFIDDVLPMFESRNMPVTIMATVGWMDWVNASTVPTERYYTLAEYQKVVKRPNVIGGLHINCQQEDFETFEEKAREHIAKTRELGLWDKYLHVTALQNTYFEAERYEFLRDFACTLRRDGSMPTISRSTVAVPVYEQGLGHNYIMPAANTTLGGVVLQDMSHLISEGDVTTWFENSVANEVGLYIYGHGTCRFRETYCANVNLFRELIRAYEDNRDKIDWISTHELYTRFENTRKYLKTKVPSEWCYVPLGW